MKTALAALLGSVALAGGAVEDACACSCVMPDADVYIERSDGAFIGRLVEKREPTRGGTWSTADPAIYVFRVEGVAKGDLPQTLHVTSAVSGASCGLEVPEGERIGLFLERDGSEWRSSLCLQVAAVDLERAANDAGMALRAPRAGADSGDAGGTGRTTEVVTAAVGLGFFLAFATVFLVWRRRTNSTGSGAEGG